MSDWTLSEIRNKVRRVTGRLTTREISNIELDKYINQYYQYTFPADVKLERAHTYYEFLTEANVQKYTFPAGYTNFEAPATMDRMLMLWYQDPIAFYENNPENIGRQTIGTGDGSTTAFNATASNFPILPDTVVITDNTEVFEDTNTDWTTANVNITGSLGGTASVNYSTGVVSVTFNTAPDNGQDISFSYIQFQAGRPVAVLEYNNKFTFYPVPDTAYRFKVKAYSNNLVIDASGDLLPFFQDVTDSPLLDEWGPAIAYGTARDIHSNYGEMDAYGEVTALYREQLGYILRRTNQNLLNVRANPHF